MVRVSDFTFKSYFNSLSEEALLATVCSFPSHFLQFYSFASFHQLPVFLVPIFKYGQGLRFHFTDLAAVQVMGSLGPSINSAIAAALGGAGLSRQIGPPVKPPVRPVTTFQVFRQDSTYPYQ